MSLSASSDRLRRVIPKLDKPVAITAVKPKEKPFAPRKAARPSPVAQATTATAMLKLMLSADALALPEHGSLCYKIPA